MVAVAFFIVAVARPWACPSVDERTAADVEDRTGQGAAPVGGGEYGGVADVVQGRGSADEGLGLDHLGDGGLVLDSVGEGVGDAAAGEGDDADAMGAELGGELAADRLDRVEGAWVPPR